MFVRSWYSTGVHEFWYAIWLSSRYLLVSTSNSILLSVKDRSSAFRVLVPYKWWIFWRQTKILSIGHLSTIRFVFQNLLAKNEIEVDLTTYTTCSTSANLHSNQQAEKNSCGPRSSPNYRALFVVNSRLSFWKHLRHLRSLCRSPCTLLSFSSPPQALCSCIPNSLPKACLALLETLIDFNESERESGVCLEDEFFLQTTNYGQIHHWIELWKLFVSVGSFLALQFSGSTIRTILLFHNATTRRTRFLIAKPSVFLFFFFHWFL